MKRTELKSTVVYKVRDTSNPTGGDYVYQGISNFHSVGGALSCILALMDKNKTNRDEYIIVEVKRTESLVTFL